MISVLHKIINSLDLPDRINVSLVCERLCEVEGRRRKGLEEWHSLNVEKNRDKIDIELIATDSRPSFHWTESYAAAEAILRRLCLSVRVRSVYARVNMNIEGQANCMAVLPLFECKGTVQVFHEQSSSRGVGCVPPAFVRSPLFFPGASTLHMARIRMEPMDYRIFYERIKRSSLREVTLDLPDWNRKPKHKGMITFARGVMGIMGIFGGKNMRHITTRRLEVAYSREVFTSPYVVNSVVYWPLQMADGEWTCRVNPYANYSVHIVRRQSFCYWTRIPFVPSPPPVMD